MAKQSAGLLVYRINAGELEVLLVHPGGPFWQKKDKGVWSIPKGEYNDDEDPLEVAKREFLEETGNNIDGDNFVELIPVRLSSGKRIKAWTIERNFEPCFLKSNKFSMEWPPKSGRFQDFDEVDRAEWYSLADASEKINAAQLDFLKQLKEKLK